MPSASQAMNASPSANEHVPILRRKTENVVFIKAETAPG